MSSLAREETGLVHDHKIRDFKLTIDGASVEGLSAMAVINPSTEQSFADAPVASAGQVEQAIAAAKRAFPNWSNLPASERHAAIESFAALIRENIDDLAEILTLEQGKPLANATGEINGAVMFMESYCKIDLSPEILRDTPEQTVELHRRAIGVVGAITAWNYPALLALWKIGSAMAAGCTMVIKPAPTTPLTTLMLGELAQKAFPPGVINTVNGGNDVGTQIVSHPDISKIAFTGSTATGKAIMANASSNLKRLTLELGGNDAGIVLDDIDPKAFANDLFWAKFSNCGQVCAALKRLYVPESLHDAIVEEVIKIAETVKIGDGFEDGVQMGPLQNSAQRDRLNALVADALDKGGEILYQGAKPGGSGYFFPVTIIGNVGKDAAAVKHEAFGPVLTVHKYSDVADALAAANDSEYGLGASVWTSDPDRGAAVAAKMEAGSSWVNNHPSMGPDIPFGGVKCSGLGVEGARWGLEEYTNIHILNVNRRQPGGE